MRTEIDIPREAMAACSEIWRERLGTDAKLPHFGLTPVEGRDEADLWAANGHFLVRIRLAGVEAAPAALGCVFDGEAPEIPIASGASLAVDGASGDCALEIDGTAHALTRCPALDTVGAERRAMDGVTPADLRWSRRYLEAIMRSAAHVVGIEDRYDRVSIETAGSCMRVRAPAPILVKGIADARWVLMGMRG